VLDLTGLDDKEVRTVIQRDGGGGGMARVLSHSHRVQVRVRFVGGREGELRASPPRFTSALLPHPKSPHAHASKSLRRPAHARRSHSALL
jgi:hypothetical protein